MKKLMLSILAMVTVGCAVAQDSYQKSPSFGIQFVLNDFKTAADLRTKGLSDLLNNKGISKVKSMSPGLAINYLQGVSGHIDFAATLSGSFLSYPVPNKTITGGEKLLLEAVATANIKLLTDKYIINPFLTAGVGASQYSGYYAAFVPLGAGLQVKITDNTFLFANSQYRVPVSENAAYHLYGAIGFVQSFGKKKEPVVEAPPIPVVLDRDHDGVLDADDKCPDVAGLANLMGCPDRDADGIADADDKCPDVAGTAKYSGCPVPDTDGDGINDENDKCITQKGLARYQGCPIPDTDKDGVNDEEDKCPTRPGTAANQGCPEIAKEVVDKINYAAKNVFFSTGSAKLLAKSNKSLDEVVSLMKGDETLKLAIDGHTDNTGKAEKNQILSEDRANAVKAYLVAKGIDTGRLTATGYGIDKPIADNKTAAGRAQNRRVEITATNY
jgi:outer membrane protein OmpA-like peptidoglycan-associated protein